MKESDKIQNLLPFGYLYLVVMGILKESLMFYQIGIPILKYSSIMDILISPVATLTSHYIIAIFVALLFWFFYSLPEILIKYGTKKWIQKAFKLDETLFELEPQEQKNHFIYISVKFSAMMLLSFFLGFGFADGRIVHQKITSNTLKINCIMHFNSGENEAVSLINTNSAYYFYVSKNNINVKIAPVGSIKNIELIKSKNKI